MTRDPLGVITTMRMAKLVLIALAISGAAALLVYRAMVGRSSSDAKPVDTTIFVAARNLEVGALIRDGDIKQAPWAGVIPKSAVLKKADLIGRGVVDPIFQDEPLLESRLAAKGAGGGLPAKIPAGMRAAAIRVNDIIGVAGFVLPGQKVDILIAGNPPGSQSEGTQARTLLQNIEVLSAGHKLQKDEEGKPSPAQVVVLLVTPEQAEILSLATAEARFQLVLRNPLDNETVKTPGTAVQRLYGQKLAAAPEAERPRRVAPRPAIVPVVKEKPQHTIEMIQGGRRDEIKFREESQ